MRILVTGARGQLGPYLLRELEQRGDRVVGWSGRGDVDLTDVDALAAAFAEARPDVVLHTAAMSKPGACHASPDQAERVNVEATRRLMGLAAQRGARLIFTSTDLVFDGERGMYDESDEAHPLSVYGRTKQQAEQVVLGAERAAVVRLSLLFGPGIGGVRTLFDTFRAGLAEGGPVQLFEDEWRTPLALPVAAAALADGCHAGVEGLFHLGGPERVSRLEFGRRLAKAMGVGPGRIEAISRNDIESAEPRPCDTSLCSNRWRACVGRGIDVDLDEALTRMVA